jgi:hypothetical protein
MYGVRITSAGGKAQGGQAVTLLLREMNAQARIEEQGWAGTDYAVLDREQIMACLYKEMMAGEQKWRWFLNTSPYPAPARHMTA